MKELIELLKNIELKIPVKWDRWTKTEEDNPFYCVYGWIERKDGSRDFLLVQMWEDGILEDAFFVTSSAKYSSEICEIITGSSREHTDCRKISELINN